MNFEEMTKAKLVRTKVVSENDLDTATSTGWRLVEVLPETEMFIGMRQVIQDAHYNGTIHVQAEYSAPPVPIPMQKHKYLVALDETSALRSEERRVGKECRL